MEKSAVFCAIASKLPSHSAHPCGAKLPANIMISPMYGSAISIVLSCLRDDRLGHPVVCSTWCYGVHLETTVSRIIGVPVVCVIPIATSSPATTENEWAVSLPFVPVNWVVDEV